MKANRFLGVSADLPTDKQHVRYDEERHGTFAAFLALDLPEIDGPLTSHGFPGGYAVVYHYADGEDVCADCANRILSERVESIGTDLADGTEIADFRRNHFGSSYRYDRDEELAGFSTMDQTDTCAFCVECNQYVLSTGCRAVSDTAGLYIADKAPDAVHGSYCNYYPENGAAVHPSALQVLVQILTDGTSDPSSDAYEIEGNAP